ncbi:MAG TPA: hypothetical protein VGL02_27355 [Streptomyces sp.]
MVWAAPPSTRAVGKVHLGHGPFAMVTPQSSTTRVWSPSRGSTKW